MPIYQAKGLGKKKWNKGDYFGLGLIVGMVAGCLLTAIMSAIL